MATRSNFFIDGADFRSATSVYTDSKRTIIAPDGWYSAEGVSREMIGGILYAPVPCVDCGGGSPTLYNLDWEVQMNLAAELSQNIIDINFQIDIDGNNEVFATSATSGSKNVPAGNGLVTLVVQYDEIVQPLGQLNLVLDSPDGVLLAQDLNNLPQPGQFSVSSSFNMNAARQIVAKINGN